MVRAGFSHESTTDDVIAGIDLSGKVALVTGASAGLGVETSRALAAAGATVLMAARDGNKTRQAMEAIRGVVPHAKLQSVSLDLSDLNSVRACAESVIASQLSLDLLINNAGVMACPLQRTAQGWEWQLGVNHIGHFLLSCLLVPLLMQSTAPRLVNLTSGGHIYGPVDFTDPHFRYRAYDKWLAYGQSKTANIWFALSMHQRLGREGLCAFAVHPGAIVTELGRHLAQEDFDALTGEKENQPALRFKTVPQGAATTVWAATSPQLEGKGGLYLEDCMIAGPSDDLNGITDGFAPWAMNYDSAEQLWEMSQGWVAQSFHW